MKNCSCAKEGHPCTNCLPARRSRCLNQAQLCTPLPTDAGATASVSALGPHTHTATPNTPPCQTFDQPAAPSRIGSPEQDAVDAESTGGLFVFDNLSPSQECSTSPQLDNWPAVVESSQHVTCYAHFPDTATIPSTDPEYPTCSGASEITSPSFTPLSSTPFPWGEVAGHIFYQDIISAYEEQVSGVKIFFSTHRPCWTIKEHTRLLCAYKDKTPLERVALWAVMVMPGLLLQKPHAKAGSREFSKHLAHRLILWKAGKVKELLDEARTIQSRLPAHDTQKGMTSHKVNRRFTTLVGKGNILPSSLNTTREGSLI